jgi:glutamate 5-kinase
MTNSRDFRHIKRCIIKIGSAMLTAHGRGLDTGTIVHWVEQVVALLSKGVKPILVSSGAVAEGMKRLGWVQRPHALFELQAAAAVGQMGLVQAYESQFQRHGVHTAQVLLTHEDLTDRKRYLNARSTINALLQLGVIPVINENDTVATDEIKFGDNDSLAALVANLAVADLLIVLTDQQGMFDKDPRHYADARLIEQTQANDVSLDLMVTGNAGNLGRGGMQTKLRAARLAARSGAATVIASGAEENVIQRIMAGENIGSLLLPDQEPLAARKQWLAGHLQSRGKLFLDDGAVKVLRESGKSLLPVGVIGVEGFFNRGELVTCCGRQGNEIARGLVNYNAEESRKIRGRPSKEIESILGYVDEPELIHRDNLVLT